MAKALVTGAAGGMGRACARRLAARGDHVVMVDVSGEALEQAREDVATGGGDLEARVCDVSDADSVSSLIKGVGPIGSIVHTAGLSGTMADWRRIIEVNFLGTARILQCAEPHVAEGSAAVCISSMASYAYPGIPAVSEIMRQPFAADLLDRLAALEEVSWDSQLAYGVSKRGVRELVARAAVRWGARGARVVSISPGIIDTPMAEKEYAASEAMHEMSRRTPLGRDGAPEEIASVAEFLCSAGASYINGSDVLVDGGTMAALGLIPK